MMSSELPVVFPGGEVRAHGMLALLSQHLLDERWIGHVNCQDGAKARLPHGTVPLHSLQLRHRRQAASHLDALPKKPMCAEMETPAVFLEFTNH